MSKYVPNLLPDPPKYKFDNNIVSSSNKNIGKKILRFFASLIGCFLIFSSIITLFFQFWSGFFLLVLGVLIFPLGHELLEKLLNFKLRIIPKFIFMLFLIFGILRVELYYIKKRQEAKEIIKESELKKAKEIQEAKQEEQQRKDSLSFFQNSIIALINSEEEISKSTDESVDKMFYYVKTKEDTLKTSSIAVDYFMKSEKYSLALIAISSLISSDYNLKESLFKRAKCYIKLDSMQLAVDDLRHSIKLGNDSAENLHNRINPVKKEFTGYTTLCCDGTTSSSRGRGACSRHRGVCNWNHKVYREYREY